MYGAHVIEYLTSLTIMYNSFKKHTKMLNTKYIESSPKTCPLKHLISVLWIQLDRNLSRFF